MAWYHRAVMWIANSAARLLPPELRAQMAGIGRLSVPINANPLNWFNWLPRKHQRAHNIDLTKLQHHTADELLEMLVSIHPDVSFALSTYLRMGDTPMNIHAVRKTGKPDPGGQRVVDELKAILNTPLSSPGYQHGRSLDKLDGIQRMMVMVRGACCGEVVLNESLTEVVDIVPVDPALIWFRRDPDTNRLIPYQWVEVPNTSVGEWYGQYKRIDTPLFIYEELDPFVDDPYGRSPILPVLQVVFFHLQVLSDLKAVVHNQGYPRITVQIAEEILLKNMPRQVQQGGPDAVRQWMNDRQREVIEYMKNLNPDDALVGWDSMKFEYIQGSGKGGMVDVKKLIDVIDTQLATSLKTLLTLLSRHQGSTETYSSVDVQLYIKSVESARAVTRRFWERAFSVAARVRGVQTTVTLEYAPIDLRSEQETERDRQLRLSNLSKSERECYITPEEAAREARIALGLDPKIPQELKEKLLAKHQQRVDQQQDNGFEGGDNQDGNTDNGTT